MKKFISKCISCDKNTSHEKKFVIKNFQIIRCLCCGLGSTKVNENFYSNNIYNQSYFEGGQEDGYANYQDSKDILKIEFNSTKDFILKNIKKSGGDLLEIGCAYGYFLETINPFFNVFGIEMSNHAVNECKKIGLNVISVDEEKKFLNYKIFDVVVMLDVIEHIVDPLETFNHISKCTKKDSLLVITTGDFGSFSSILLGKYWRLMTPPQHLWFFNKRSIINLLKKYNFKVESISYPSKFVPISLIIYQIARYLRIQKLIMRINIPGAIRINLFDSMRIVARKI